MENTKLNIKDKCSIFSEDKVSLYYAGVLYDNGRDPRPLFNALTKLKKENGYDFELIFQGAGDGSQFKEFLKEIGIQENVKFISGVSFQEALINMLKSDVLVLIQGEKFNRQIPGKVYDYLASGKNILLQTPIESATSNSAGSYDGVWVGEDESILYSNLLEIFDGDNYKKEHVREVSNHSRQKHVQKLLNWSNNLISNAD